MSSHPFDLAASASAEMVREGFHPDFPRTEDQVAEIRAIAALACLGRAGSARAAVVFDR